MRGHLQTTGLIAALALVAAMGKAPAPSIGDACTLLKAVETSDVLGADPTYDLSTTTDDVQIWGNCTATSADDSRWISFSIYESLYAPSQSPVELRDAYLAEEIKSEDDRALFETPDFAEAAIWEKIFGMLVFWDMDGRIQFSVKAYPIDRAAVDRVAERIVANLP